MHGERRLQALTDWTSAADRIQQIRRRADPQLFVGVISCWSACWSVCYHVHSSVAQLTNLLSILQPAIHPHLRLRAKWSHTELVRTTCIFRSFGRPSLSEGREIACTLRAHTALYCKRAATTAASHRSHMLGPYRPCCVVDMSRRCASCASGAVPGRVGGLGASASALACSDPRALSLLCACSLFSVLIRDISPTLSLPLPMSYGHELHR